VDIMKWFHGLSTVLCVMPASAALELFETTQTPVLQQYAANIPIRILTHNIRYATSTPFKGEELWSKRKSRLVNELKFNARHNLESFICLQEVLHIQLNDILSGLNQDSASIGPSREAEWAYIGIGRDNGKAKGEYSPIFYRPSIWKLQHWETVWLSKTPSRPSRGWDASNNRIVTIGVFQHLATGKSVIALNTHLDDQGSESRFHAAHIILNKIYEYLNGVDKEHISGVFLAGDLNSSEDQEAYLVLTSPSSPLYDAQKADSLESHYGNELTYTGFGYENEPQTRIDYVMLGPNEQSEAEVDHIPWKVHGYAVLANKFDDGVFSSDHRGVVVDTLLC